MKPKRFEFEYVAFEESKKDLVLFLYVWGINRMRDIARVHLFKRIRGRS